MAYLLPRAILVVLAWGLTCALIRKFWPDANSVIFFLAAVSWAGAAGAYFGQDVRGLIDRLVAEQLPDGGWNCEAENGSTRSFG